jgi:hypothetical protein
MYAVFFNQIRRSASEILFRKIRHNGISCHPTSTLLKKPCDSQRLPEVII